MLGRQFQNHAKVKWIKLERKKNITQFYFRLGNNTVTFSTYETMCLKCYNIRIRQTLKHEHDLTANEILSNELTSKKKQNIYRCQHK